MLPMLAGLAGSAAGGAASRAASGGGLPGQLNPADFLAIANALFGKKTETQTKRRVLNANYWNMVRNRAELGAWGTQAGLDVRQGVKDANATAQNFVRNQGLAGSTVTPTLMAANFRRGADQLARIGEQKRTASMGINNAFNSGLINGLQMPSSPSTLGALSSTAQQIRRLGGMPGLESLLGGLSYMRMANATPSNTAQSAGIPGGGSYRGGMYDAFNAQEGFYSPKPVESGTYNA